MRCCGIQYITRSFCSCKPQFACFSTFGRGRIVETITCLPFAIGEGGKKYFLDTAQEMTEPEIFRPQNTGSKVLASLYEHAEQIRSVAGLNLMECLYNTYGSFKMRNAIQSKARFLAAAAVLCDSAGSDLRTTRK